MKCLICGNENENYVLFGSGDFSSTELFLTMMQTEVTTE